MNNFMIIFIIFVLYFILADVPQKRVDRHRSNGTNIGQSPNPNNCRPSIVAQLAEGSPLVPRRQLYSTIKYFYKTKKTFVFIFTYLFFFDSVIKLYQLIIHHQLVHVHHQQ